MSRVAKQPITIPEGVKVELNDNLVSVSGKNGSMEFELVKDVTVDISENEVLVSYGDYQESVAMGGTTRAILNNMVVGVSQGFEKKLELVEDKSFETLFEEMKEKNNYSNITSNMTDDEKKFSFLNKQIILQKKEHSPLKLLTKLQNKIKKKGNKS